MSNPDLIRHLRPEPRPAESTPRPDFRLTPGTAERFRLATPAPSATLRLGTPGGLRVMPATLRNPGTIRRVLP